MNFFDKPTWWAAVASTALIGCAASLPKYTEPVPARTPVARLRVAMPPGINLRALIFPNGDGECVSKEGGAALAVETNVSGFGGDSSKKLGMPFRNSAYGRWGSEFYIPTSGRIAIEVSYANGNGLAEVSCHKAFRFQPEAGRDYQLVLVAGFSGRFKGTCSVDFGAIQDGNVDQHGAPILSPVPVYEAAIEGTAAWSEHCVRSN